MLLAARRSRTRRLRLPAAWAAWLASAVHEEEDELAEAIRPAPGTWRDGLAAAWYAGLTVLALALAWRGRGLSRLPGALIIAGYLAFTAALAAAVARPAVIRPPPSSRPPPSPRPGPWCSPGRTGTGPPPGGGGGRCCPAGTSAGCGKATLLACSAVAACDAATGRHLILIGVLAAGPCCALLTARWALTAAATGYALALGTVLGVPDHIFATALQYTLLAAVAAAGTAATFCAAALQRRDS